MDVLDFVKDLWYLNIFHEEPDIFFFFGNVCWCTISSSNLFHKCDIPNLVYVIIHGEKTFRTLHCQKCVKHFKKKLENHGTLKQKSRIRETLYLSTDADRSTNPFFFFAVIFFWERVQIFFLVHHFFLSWHFFF